MRRRYKKIGVVTSRKVFEATPEYKQIARRKLAPNTAEWCFLAKAASDKFRTAVDKTVKTGGYDLIAENGAITVEGHDRLRRHLRDARPPAGRVV